MAGWDTQPISSVSLDLHEKDDKPLSEQKITRANARDKFQRFFSSFRSNAGEGDPFPYRKQILAAFRQNEFRVTINMEELRSFDHELSDALLHRPDDYLDSISDAAKAIIISLTATQKIAAADIPTIQTIVNHLPVTDTIRNLAAPNVERMVSITGIIINAGKPRIKATTIAMVCRSCKTVRYMPCGAGFSVARLPRNCDGPANAPSAAAERKKCSLDPFEVLPDSSTYIDQQKLKLQESPESVPTGEMPRSLNLSVERYLTNRVKPGQTVRVIGVYTTFSQKSGGSGTTSRASQAASSTARDVGIRIPYVRVLGLAVESEDGANASGSFTPEQEEQIQAIARSPKLYDKIARSVGPALYGNEDIKRAIACQLFGGSRKQLPDGMKLRGDINVLLLGDPSVGKSQFLKFAYTLAPVGVYTSGKGASAAGLTASVIRDPSTGEFQLEGGALVLGNGGLVCIDEFDKMREQDRVAIHEAMEQQTISIAKAGITTILKSETSVLAAANPVFGRYDDMKTPTENIDFQTTILSRFDIIFIIKDVQDTSRDQALVKYIMSIHRDRGQSIVDQQSAGDIIDSKHLKTYIDYARKRVHPRLSEDAANVLKNHYVNLRAEHRKHSEQYKQHAKTPFPMTVRQLEALVRISESIARLELKDVATAEHVNEAIRLFKDSTFKAATGDTGGAGPTAEFLSRVQGFERIIKSRVMIGSKIGRDTLIRQVTGDASSSYEDAAKKAIEIMVMRNEFKQYAMGKMLERLR